MDNLLNEALGMAKEADRLEKLSKTYKSCFNTEAGKEALKDLIREVALNSPTGVLSEAEANYINGAKSIVLRIKNLVEREI